MQDITPSFAEKLFRDTYFFSAPNFDISILYFFLDMQRHFTQGIRLYLFHRLRASFNLLKIILLSINLEFAYFFNISIYITCDTFHVLRILFRTLNTNTVGFYLIMQINRLFMTKRNFLPVQNIYLFTKSLPFCYSSVILQVIIIT